MPKNIEIKAKIDKDKSENLHQILIELCGKPREIMRQEDTFFNAENGRLKLRDFLGHPNGVIYIFFCSNNIYLHIEILGAYPL